MSDKRRSLPHDTYVELVRSLFATLLPTVIMTTAFLTVGAVINFQTPDLLLAILMLLGGLALIARLSVLILHKKEAATARLSWERARTLERRFACAYFSFAATFSAFSARAFVVAGAEAHMLIIGLLFGYGAGVAAGLSLRPWISVTSILIATLPTIIIALLSASISYVAVGLLLAIFTIGGVESMLARYRVVAHKEMESQVFQALARRDDLTGLPNRLSLRERFEAFMAGSDAQNGIAVHCLDLDRFKPVNDLYGHPVGDALLRAVSERLTALLRRSDFAARLGGDEFVIIQTGAVYAEQADMLARRILRAIGEPFIIEGHRITIGTSVGYALSSVCGNELETLMACADEALVDIKRKGGGIVRYRPPVERLDHRLAS
ncbi:GGDEF domain-containing protein [Sphingobium boeckii]|uniref:Diguanylate cyclase (GGDEF)-like protein n=1 Tax=Sphingobium boeckii TaxID=1082345 RepID=A0A7W9AH35_9SPHN|nr:GGDEF domain-containing protein [Sphingobium boeckii]MBB5685567.1 diguanylate cyclase (GGDEF)-like protein [Sphingobium boeckii]